MTDTWRRCNNSSLRGFFSRLLCTRYVNKIYNIQPIYISDKDTLKHKHTNTSDLCLLLLQDFYNSWGVKMSFLVYTFFVELVISLLKSVFTLDLGEEELSDREIERDVCGLNEVLIHKRS